MAASISVVGTGDASSALNVGAASGETDSGDVNISGEFKINGTPIGGGSGGGGAPDPGITYTGSIVSPFKWISYPTAGEYLDGTYTADAINFISYEGADQPNLLTLTVANASGLFPTSYFNPTMATLTTFSLPALTTIGSNVNFQPNMADLTTLDLSALTTIGPGAGFVLTMADLTTFSLPALTTIGSGAAFQPNMAALTTFSFGSGLLDVETNISITGAALTQASVDGILVSLSLLNGTGGTTQITGQVIDLSGGTSASPSATGLAAKAILVTAGNTVNTN